MILARRIASAISITVLILVGAGSLWFALRPDVPVIAAPVSYDAATAPLDATLPDALPMVAPAPDGAPGAVVAPDYPALYSLGHVEHDAPPSPLL